MIEILENLIKSGDTSKGFQVGRGNQESDAKTCYLLKGCESARLEDGQPEYVISDDRKEEPIPKS